jgi:hypothetical protein
MVKKNVASSSSGLLKYALVRLNISCEIQGIIQALWVVLPVNKMMMFNTSLIIYEPHDKD